MDLKKKGGMPLVGVRVLELTTMITGPLAGMLLGDMGASIIKIENRENGDPFRNFFGGFYSGHFLSYNRGKRSITLDLRSEKGKEIFAKLVQESDVLIDNFRAGVLERLSFGEAKLKSLNPSLIHASITGFGSTGPYRDRPSYDAVAQALSGVLSQFVDPARPQPSGPTVADNITGFYAAYGVLAALYDRAKTGKGRRIETTMLEATLAFAPDGLINYKRHGFSIGPLTRVSTSQSFAFRCSDGAMIAIHLSSQEKFWLGLLAAVDLLDLAEDARFATRDNRIKNYTALSEQLARSFVRHPRSTWTALLEKHDVPHAPILTIPELESDPQIDHMGTLYRTAHPQEGEVWGVRSPFLFDHERLPDRSPPPVLGEHSVEILTEFGYSADEIKELRLKKVI
jgi:formyl-CoA transferase